MNPRIRLAAILSAIVLLAGVAYGMFFTDKARIRRGVAAAARAFEERDLDGFMLVISRSYQDENRETWDEIRSAVAEAFGGFESFKVTMEKIDIQVTGDGARYSCLLTVTARSREKEAYMVIGTPESGQHLVLSLRRESAGWRVVQASGYAR